MKKVIFFSSDDIAAAVYDNLLKKYQVVAHVIQFLVKPDSEILKLSLQNKIPVIQSSKISVDDLQKYTADIAVIFSFGQIISQAVIDSFPYGIINIHPSLLPKYRGSSPIQYALLNNEKITGVSIIKMIYKLDAGPILSQSKIIIDSDDNYQTLATKVSQVAAVDVIFSLDKIFNNNQQEIVQDENNVTFTKMITKQDGQIFNGDSSDKIYNKYRAFTNWPGIFIIVQNKRIKLIDLKKIDNKIIINKIQPEGKKVMLFQQFCLGYKHLLADFPSCIET